MATGGTAVPMPPLEAGQTYSFTTRQLFDYVDTGTYGWKAVSNEGWTPVPPGPIPPASTPPPGMTVTAGTYTDTTTPTFTGSPTVPGDYIVVLRYTDRYNSKKNYNVLVNVAELGPEPVEVSDAKANVAALMGQPDNPDLIAVIDQALNTINAMVSAYTRGNGFLGGVPNRELRAVIQAATARLTANPEQVSSTVGGVTIGAGFSGWSLAELAVLNRYRKRAL